MARRFSHSERKRTSLSPAAVLDLVAAAIEDAGGTITQRAESCLEARTGSLWNAMYRSPDTWLMTISAEVTVVDAQTDLTLTFTDGGPFGTRRGTERSLQKGFETMVARMSAGIT